MNMFKIQQQTEAEKDDYLIDCFHDGGFINSLILSNFSIVTGRKGTGKTALARYLEKKSDVYGIDLVYRISVRDISIGEQKSSKDHINSLLTFIIIKTVKHLSEKGIFLGKSKKYWTDFLIQNGLQQISDYETFLETKNENSKGSKIKGLIFSLFAKVGGEYASQGKSDFSRAIISCTPASLIEALRQSLPSEKDIYIFIDDISDYLDIGDDKLIKEEISTIQNLLLRLEVFNSSFADAQKGLRFISLIREDLFEFMEGSNINKLKSNTLNLEWNEESFAGLLVRRLPFFQDRLEESLSRAKESLREQFPDSIFSNTLKDFDTKRYATNFYAYMVAVSFNRPRDFLMFCYAMRQRLSLKHAVTFENIEAAEIEYSDYFTRELRDELFLASRILGFKANQENVNHLIDIMGKKDSFNSSELRTDLAQYLGEKTSRGKRKIEAFIEELWHYGILGFKEEKDELINFRYISGRSPFLVSKIKNYVLFLHRGLWWFAKKRKNKNMN